MRRFLTVALMAAIALAAVAVFAPSALAFGDQLSVTVVRLSQDGTATPLPGENAGVAVPIPQPPAGAAGEVKTPLPGETFENVRGGDCSGGGYSSSSSSYRASSSSSTVIVGSASKREARRKSRHVERAVGFSAGVAGVYGAGVSGASSGVTRSKSVERYRN